MGEAAVINTTLVGDETARETPSHWAGWTREAALACYHSAVGHPQGEQEDGRPGPAGQTASSPAPPGSRSTGTVRGPSVRIAT